ncbi:chemotaxis protein CheW [Natrarchaeobaculum sulfurireducens]|uniref:Chemotaxis signal transduction protein n=1 Tax=Natrarchaeobaculum sulfurireducens TaxID=2044521 RepID=A0A346PGB9_9EURY|nr:chemotaxis protein CheW [Natrarchaeobaculum sulfurireducens]AXR78564.1 Chemotaxis signal transduction protein [Natrarchaeobaculum sulfurireducens]
MAPDLPEKLLGIDIDPVEDQRRRSQSDSDESEAHVRVVLFGVGEHRLAVPVDDVISITDVPDDLTWVPRTPDAIDGVTDLRGEVTAVLDPTVYFPVAEDRTGREQLLVFDSSDDEQSAALRVDDVLTVEAVPESNVLESVDDADDPLSGEALEHPLVTALVERTRQTRRSPDAVPSTATVSGAIDDSELADEVAEDVQVVEFVPLVDIDGMLAASSHRVSSR